LGTSKSKIGRFGLNKNQRDLFIAIILILISDILIYLISTWLGALFPMNFGVIFLVVTLVFDLVILFGLALIYQKRNKKGKPNIRRSTKRVVTKKGN